MAADPERFSLFLESTLARLQDVAGVTAVAAGSGIPVERGLNVPLSPPPGGQIQNLRAVDWRYVTPDYFDVFRISIREGRSFDERDTVAGLPVALVNEALARAYYGRIDVIGQSLQLEPGFDDVPREIVGVVADVRTLPGSGWTRGLAALAAPAAPTMYVPAAQVPQTVVEVAHQFFPMNWVVRTTTAGPRLERDVESVMSAIDSTLPFVRFDTMESIIANDLAFHRLITVLTGAFAFVALSLATIGLYGLVAYTVSRRVREVGILMALGATRGRVLREFMREGVLLTSAGVVVGLVLAGVVTRGVTVFLFGVTPLDLPTYIGVTSMLAAAALVATAIPASRAARTDPAVALRSE